MKPDQKIVYQSGVIALSEMDTERGKRIILDMGTDAVLIVPRFSDGTYLLVTQIRPGKSTPTYEFPSGGIQAGESPMTAATRELLEETGAAGKMTFLKATEPLSGVVKFTVHVFLAEVEHASESHMNPDAHEIVQPIRLTKNELISKMDSLEIVDGYVLLGLGALNLFDTDA